MARLMVDAGLLVLATFISPFRADRAAVKRLPAPGEFIEAHVHAPLELAEMRDPKDLYAKARRGQLKDFTGIDSPYETPESPDLRIDTATLTAEEAGERVIEALRSVGIVRV